MSNTAVQTTEPTNESATTAKRKGGRPANPNSLTKRANALLAVIPDDKFTKIEMVKMLVDELNCKESSAMVYFYTAKSARKKASVAATAQV